MINTFPYHNVLHRTVRLLENSLLPHCGCSCCELVHFVQLVGIPGWSTHNDYRNMLVLQIKAKYGREQRDAWKTTKKQLSALPREHLMFSW